ncbi:MAG: retron-type reverse transcriptase [Granulosicoccus sp.]|jgi:retron-type reverse transcriptase
MKRAGNLIAKIVEPDNLRLAFWKARKGKDGKLEVETYRKQLDENLLLLREQILSGNVAVGNYHYFTIYDPKERVICAASFPERVLHHALMNICHDVFENYQIYDSYATRKDKGTYAALHRAEFFQKKYHWFLKLDVRKYFDSIDHSILLRFLERRFKDQKLLSIFETIISSYHVEPGKGVPIGNLTSQYFANFYLAFADRFVKGVLKIPAYVRYMDDMVLWHHDKEKLIEAGTEIKNFLKVELELNLKIFFLNKNTHGLAFIGYRLFCNCTKLSIRSKKRFKEKMSLYYDKLEKGDWTEEDFQRHVLPLIAFTRYASAVNFRKKILEKNGQ